MRGQAAQFHAAQLLTPGLGSAHTGRPPLHHGMMCTPNWLLVPAGNFKTLQQAIAEYGADAMRIALADAGAPLQWWVRLVQAN